MGLPLALAFAAAGRRVLVVDIDVKALAVIAGGVMPFRDEGAGPRLKDALANGLLALSASAADLADVPIVIVSIGTPAPETAQSPVQDLVECVDVLLPHLSSDQLLVIRSTLPPGTTEWLERYLRGRGACPMIAYCPERIAQGHGLEELATLPQIVSGTTAEAEAAAAALFLQVAPEVVKLQPRQAELAKLFCNAYRYIQFAAVNQFYVMAAAAGLDGHAILAAMAHHYPRLGDLPRVGLAAGPCLPKDTLQLEAVSRHPFTLGHAATLANQAMPLHIVEMTARVCDLANATVGLLGMAFKAESDDTRSSQSYSIKSLLLARAKAVLTTDPYVSSDPDLLPLEEVVARSDVLILCTPHDIYRALSVGDKPLVDVWNFLGGSGRPVIASRRDAAAVRAGT